MSLSQNEYERLVTELLSFTIEEIRQAVAESARKVKFVATAAYRGRHD